LFQLPGFKAVIVDEANLTFLELAAAGGADTIPVAVLNDPMQSGWPLTAQALVIKKTKRSLYSIHRALPMRISIYAIMTYLYNLKETLVAISFHPRPGQILYCDFSEGFKPPEMVKKRPVIVISKPIQGRGALVTIVALSTTVPQPIKPFHYKLPKASMPQLGRFQEKDTWVKGDMLYTVGHHRLDLIRLNKRNPDTGKRVYFKDVLGRQQMKQIFSCVLEGLGLGTLADHL
jgi:uncharacterized protein YifN (PemK superfamily)